MTTKTRKASLRQNPLLRKMLYGAPIRVAGALVRLNMPKAALTTLALPDRLYTANDRMLTLRAKAERMKGNTEAYSRAEVNRLHALIKRHSVESNYSGILSCMAQLEKIERSAPLVAGKKIASQIVSEAGRARLLSAAKLVRKSHPNSLYLEHLIALCRAMAGDYQKTGAALAEKLNKIEDTTTPEQRYRYEVLRSTWRIVDLVARGEMEWSGSAKDLIEQSKKDTHPEVGANSGYASIEQTAKNLLGFKEVALQGRMRDEYLDVCEQEFQKAKSPKAKLRAIADMLRTGIRHISSYKQSYERALRCLNKIETEYQAVLDSVPTKLNNAQNGQNVDALCLLLELSKKLDLPDLTQRTANTLLQWAELPFMEHAIFPIATAFYQNEQDTDRADQIMEKVTAGNHLTNRQIRDYFRWAMLARRYEAANALFEKLTPKQRQESSTLFYVHILTRQGRFADALNQLYVVQAFLLSRPHKLSAYANFDLIKRVGELRFLTRTAVTYSKVPQPTDPKGVIIITPRNIDHLRRNPIISLIEMKRQGWAVIPLVEGLLPREETGIAELDLLNGAVSGHRYLSEEAKRKMAPLDDFCFDAPSGKFTWGDIDLSHPLWEDAAINRRRHSIDLDCPALQEYSGNLVKWTEPIAYCIQHAHSVTQDLGLRLGMLSLFGHRLPDALFRPYCERKGDPETCFFLHGANGYQNYFTNFSTNVSVRYALRNLTRVPHVRTASFPIPENFNHYFQQNKHRADEALERFGGVTKIKRSTVGMEALPDEARAAAERIDAWRAKGGKVICAFGKVLCDSSVPYDGGPAHKDIRDWINHAIAAARGSDTLLLIKPHPHELNDQIATFPTEYFRDILTEDFGENTMFLEHRWFDIHDIGSRIDMGLIYNGTTTVELGLMGVPCLLAGHFANADYPIGQATVEDRQQFEQHIRFEIPIIVAADLRQRSAMWLDYMSNDDFTQPYRYHVRPVTNKVLYPPWWEADDLDLYFSEAGDPAVTTLTGRALGTLQEPGHPDYVDSKIDEPSQESHSVDSSEKVPQTATSV